MEIQKRRKLFCKLLPPLPGKDDRNDIKDLPNSCPLCGYPTLNSRSRHDICYICKWQDDGQDEEEKNEVRGGPNGEYSIDSYRIKFSRLIEDLKNYNGNESSINELREAILLLEKMENSLSEKNIASFMAQLKKAGALMEIFSRKRPKRKFGSAKGKKWISTGFDDHLEDFDDYQ